MVTRQLFQLQELDSRIEQEEQALLIKTGMLGKRQSLDDAQSRLNAAKEKLSRLSRQRRDAEWEADDLRNKIITAEKQLYGGRITNPKELASLQHEVELMKARRDQTETKALELIEAVETAEKEVSALSQDYRTLEEQWRKQQEGLGAEIEKLKASLAELKERRKELALQIDAAHLDLYEKLRQQKKLAVAKVEQGICGACRISLSASLLQKARSGQAVQCGTCGRILFIS